MYIAKVKIDRSCFYWCCKRRKNK